MENNLITYKWEQGIYSLEDMVILVSFGKITPEEFFKITRYDYAAVAKQMQNPAKKI